MCGRKYSKNTSDVVDLVFVFATGGLWLFVIAHRNEHVVIAHGWVKMVGFIVAFILTIAIVPPIIMMMF
jgi:hypothetical protein